MILLTGTDAYVQFITVLVVFVLVLGVTAWTTGWIAKYQKKQGSGRNIEVIETTKTSSNTWIQIVRVGNSYKAIAVCKESVTLLGDVPEEELKPGENGSGISFKALLEKAAGDKSRETDIHKDKDADD
jgi:flagellar protein FliO/FliZ